MDARDLFQVLAKAVFDSPELITNDFTNGQSMVQPQKMSNSVFPPVITIFPESKHNNTMGLDGGL
jgi:hypothetical protein